MNAAVAVAVVAAGLLFAGPAGAETVSCGQVITADTTVDNDLVDCPEDGLVIGAPGITLDLNGHGISGRFDGHDCQTDCIARHGIDSRGFDRITIKNGSVGNFKAGVFLQGTAHSRLVDLRLTGGPTPLATGVGLLLLRSDHNRVQRVTSGRGDPGILLWESRRNAIVNSVAGGSVSIHRGTGLVLYAGSDENRIADTRISGDWTGLEIIESDGNRVAGCEAGGYVGNRLEGDRNVVIGCKLDGGRSPGMSVDGSRNRIKENTVSGDGGLLLSGDRNLIAGNSVRDSFFGGIVVGAGDRNTVRDNSVVNSSSPSYGIHVRTQTTRTRLVENVVTDSEYDGIFVEAPGTVVGRNTANDNGDLGINAVSGIVDAGGNAASGNGNPLQCINVACR